MKTTTLKKMFVATTALFLFGMAKAQTPPINGCNCTNFCGIAPSGGYDFTNNLPCNIDIRYTLVDMSSGTPVGCTGGIVTIPAGGVICLFSCTDFNSCGSGAGPWDIWITLFNINTTPVTGPGNFVDHAGTSPVGPTPSPDPCTPVFNLAVSPCGASAY